MGSKVGAEREEPVGGATEDRYAIGDMQIGTRKKRAMVSATKKRRKSRLGSETAKNTKNK